MGWNYIINGPDVWWETSVDTKHFILYDGSEWQIIEYVCAVSPNIQRLILSETLVIETIDLCDLSTLVIPPNQSDPIRIPDFKGKKQQKCLNTVEAPVDKIPQKQVVNMRDITTLLE